MSRVISLLMSPLVWVLKPTFFSFFAVIIPAHGKRIIFITSVYLHLLKEKTSCFDALSRLNDALSLVQNTDALRLPSQIYEYMWDEKLDRVIQGQLTNQIIEGDANTIELTEFCTAIVKSTPMWMRYGDFGFMLKDTMRTIGCIEHNDKTHAMA